MIFLRGPIFWRVFIGVFHVFFFQGGIISWTVFANLTVFNLLIVLLGADPSGVSHSLLM